MTQEEVSNLFSNGGQVAPPASMRKKKMSQASSFIKSGKKSKIAKTSGKRYQSGGNIDTEINKSPLSFKEMLESFKNGGNTKKQI